VRANYRETLLDDLIALGARLIPGLKESRDRSQAARAALDQLEQPSAKPWLLIYDDVQDPSDIESLMPRRNARVIITSRRSGWHAAVHELALNVYPHAEAVEYLLARAHGARDRQEEVRAAAERLAKSLGNHPLALDLARSYCWAMNMSYDAYRERLHDLIDKTPGARSPAQSVLATLTLAIEQAVARTPEADTLMGLLAFLAPDRIPLDLDRLYGRIDRSGEAHEGKRLERRFLHH
jgi:hypothetical protein